MYVCIYMCVSLCVYMYVCICIYIYIYMCVCVCIYIYKMMNGLMEWEMYGDRKRERERERDYLPDTNALCF